MSDKEMPKEHNPEEENSEIENVSPEDSPVEEATTHFDDKGQVNLSGMYQEWFLDYASYVILERAVPHINDGLKPVQRRILHSMKRMDDGRYNKVANIIGHTMQFHPHGDASIGDALVQLGQKELLIDAQGNWGNIFTGDSAAAARYIEARLSKFALDVTFSPKVTEWKASYDGRNKEPLTLPVKFPLLLAQGVEGIAVGLASKILPHNFNELIDAAVNYLEGRDFEIYPDFLTGGYIDVSRYNDGMRGGAVKVRAKITKLDNKTLVIQDIPYGKNTTTLIESILRANDKGKIKIKKVDDNTAALVEILVHLAPGTSSDKTIDALYAFSDCEVSISPNCCVIEKNKPRFIGVSEVLRTNANNTVEVLKQELLVRQHELEEQWHMLSLEKIFIEERIYKDKEYENAKDRDAAIVHIDKRLEPFKMKFIREVSNEDIIKLFEIKMGRILKFNADKAQDRLFAIEKEIKKIKSNIKNIVPFTIEWFKNIKVKYGANFPRKTEIRNFENIIASKVVVANEKLYINRKEGFIGTTLRKDELICNCSDIDDVLIIYKDGRYLITKVSEKQFVGPNIIYINVFKKNDKRTVYNLVYRDGKNGNYMMKRCFINGLTRDKEYNLTKGTPGSRINYFTANPNGEAEIIRVNLKPKPRVRTLVFEQNFSDLAIKGRGASGNILSKSDIHKIALKHKGVSTLGGRKIYFDQDVLRLNSDKRGLFLGEFLGDDKILVVTKSGSFYVTNFDLSNHYNKDIELIEKYDPAKVWSVVLWDADKKFHYVKRFQMEASVKQQSFIGENPESKFLIISTMDYPQLLVTFGGHDAVREALKVDVENFISLKSFKARGKRLSTFKIKKIDEIEPVRENEIKEEEEVVEAADVISEDISDENDEGEDEMDDGDVQMTLF